MTGSASITLVFLIFGAILLYVFLKLSKLKKETAYLNKQMKNTTGDLSNLSGATLSINQLDRKSIGLDRKCDRKCDLILGSDYDRKSIGLDAIGNEIYCIGVHNKNFNMAMVGGDDDLDAEIINAMNIDINSPQSHKLSINNSHESHDVKTFISKYTWII
eukprot:522748_1